MALAAAAVGPVGPTIEERVTLLSTGLEPASVSACAAADADGDQRITFDEILMAVSGALGCCTHAGAP